MVGLIELVTLLAEELTDPLILPLSPAQLSAVEIYILDDAHEEEPWYDKVHLVGSKLVIKMDKSAAIDMLNDASNSANEGDGKHPDRGAVTALSTLKSKIAGSVRKKIVSIVKPIDSLKNKVSKAIKDIINDPEIDPRKELVIGLNPLDYTAWVESDKKDPTVIKSRTYLKKGKLGYYLLITSDNEIELGRFSVIK